ncbi:MAG: lysine--tRNA ligase [Patescibacteria group bacterium]
MSRLDESRVLRLEKLHSLEKAGVQPYPAKSERTTTIVQAINNFQAYEDSKKMITVSGRIRSVRRHGGSSFYDLEDGTGSFQIFCKLDRLGKEKYEQLRDCIDTGDIVEFTGTVFKTKQGQPTLDATTYHLLAKALRAMPEAHFGLKDVETRLRKRYLDLAVNPKTRDLFVKKSIFWQAIRSFMIKNGFLEVETPVLENVPGGAEAEPFITHHNTLHRDLFLRISLELPLKRLLVGGYEKVFEIGRIFRNEGISTEHLQDYTQLEFYWSYADYHQLMEFVQRLYREVIKKVTGSLVVVNNNQTIDWKKAWVKYDYYNEFKKYTGCNLEKATDEELRQFAKKQGITLETYVGRGRLIDAIYKKCVRPKLVQPGFLMDPPAVVEPLAKRRVDAPDRVQRFQVVAWGTELGKGFSELNDPLDQRKRFEEQMSLRAAGDKEAQRLDEDYLEALEYGMPPAAGFGLSERLFAVIMDKPVRETVLFPPMKEYEKETHESN